MGQPIVVVEKPSVANPGMVRFETNRALTGMGHERYSSDQEVRGDRPPDELARRLLARGGVEAVHINGSVVTVDLTKGHTAEGLAEVIESLYIHYPPTDEAPEAEAEETPAETAEAPVKAEAAEPEPEPEPEPEVAAEAADPEPEPDTAAEPEPEADPAEPAAEVSAEAAEEPPSA